jgi:chemotaxis receptor (MCP) glutamine deamidase CheD
MLQKEEIPIISYSVGGVLGRKVIFFSGTGDVLISYIKHDITTRDQGAIHKFNPSENG